MAGLVPAIHVLFLCKDVDARHKAGHDGSLRGVRFPLWIKSGAGFFGIMLYSLNSAASGTRVKAILAPRYCSDRSCCEASATAPRP
jgi:hypothetical protein